MAGLAWNLCSRPAIKTTITIVILAVNILVISKSKLEFHGLLDPARHPSSSLPRSNGTRRDERGAAR